jgi:hypothetical protein
MDERRFEEFCNEIIPQQLFHVEPTDLDDKTGGKLDETILVGLIANSPECLKHKPLRWFLDTYLITEEEWNKQIKKNEDYLKNLSVKK